MSKKIFNILKNFLLFVVLSILLIYNLSGVIALVITIIVHELGHIIAAKRLNVPIKGIHISLFTQAVLLDDDTPLSKYKISIIALGGPLFGLILCLFCIGLYIIYPNEFVLQMCKFSAIINVINLLPLPFGKTDGQQIIENSTLSITPYTRKFVFANLVFFSIILNLIQVNIWSIVTVFLVICLYNLLDHSYLENDREAKKRVPNEVYIETKKALEKHFDQYKMSNSEIGVCMGTYMINFAILIKILTISF